MTLHRRKDKVVHGVQMCHSPLLILSHVISQRETALSKQSSQTDVLIHNGSLRE